MSPVARVLTSALLVVLTSCGSSGTPAEKALKKTADNLGDIRSATMNLRMAAESPGAKGPVGFEMRGPFSLPEKEGLPVANLELTELRGDKETTATFVATGRDAWVVRDGKPVRVPGGVSVGGDSGGLGTLRIDEWLRDPVMTQSPEGDRIKAGLNVAAAFDDLARFGERIGSRTLAGLRPLDDEARKQLDASARDSSIEVVTGPEDRLLRVLAIRVTLAAAGTLPESLRSMVPVTLSLQLDLDDVNEPVHVQPPPGI